MLYHFLSIEVVDICYMESAENWCVSLQLLEKS